MGIYSIYFIGTMVMLALYWYYASKVKTHSNYVVVWAITIGFLVYMSHSNIAWLIENINKYTPLELSVPSPASDLTMLGFGLFLLAVVWIYYANKENKASIASDNSQKNSFKSWLNFGSVKQKNEK